MIAGEHLRDLFLAVAFLGLVCGVREDVEKHEVYEVSPQTKEDVKALKGLLTLTDDNGDGIFARKSFRLNGGSIVVVHPNSLQKYTDLVTANQILSTKLAINVTADMQKMPLPDADWIGLDGNPAETFQSIQTIEDWMANVALKYPKIAKLETIGETTGDGGKKYSLQVMSISLKLDAATKPPGVFILAGTNPENPETTGAACYVIYELTQDQNQHTHLLENHIFYVLPLYNPTGLEYLQRTGIFTAKNRSKPKTAGGKCPGVNLAYHFHYKWNTHLKDSDVEKDECSPYFSGDAPCSEEECKAVSKFILEHKNIEIFFDILQNTQSWLYPPAASPHPDMDNATLMDISTKATLAMHKVHNTTFDVASVLEFEAGEPQGGMAVDWAREVAKIKYAFMVNLRDPVPYLELFTPLDYTFEVNEEVWKGIEAAVKAKDQGNRASAAFTATLELVILCGASAVYKAFKI